VEVEGLGSRREQYFGKPTWGNIRSRSHQYTILSDVFRCCRCEESCILWDVTVDSESGKVAGQFNCPHCGFHRPKTKHKRIDSVPVVTNYAYVDVKTGKKRRAEHRTTPAELAKIRDIEAKEIP
jgi:hypothetical protein